MYCFTPITNVFRECFLPPWALCTREGSLKAKWNKIIAQVTGVTCIPSTNHGFQFQHASNLEIMARPFGVTSGVAILLSHDLMQCLSTSKSLSVSCGSPQDCPEQFLIKKPHSLSSDETKQERYDTKEGSKNTRIYCSNCKLARWMVTPPSIEFICWHAVSFKN